MAKNPTTTATTDFVRAVGLRIQEARKGKGWTQAALAAHIGVEAPTLSRLENGNRPVNLPLLEKIANGLGMKPADLLDVDHEIPAVSQPPDEAALLGFWRALSPDRQQLLMKLASEMVKQ